jgi:3-hydroxyisobutyrate dehydrogenase
MRDDGARGGDAARGECGDQCQPAPEALAGGFADSLPLQLFVPRMVQGIHSPPLDHIATLLKDLDTVIDVARDTASPVPMAGLAAQLFKMARSAPGPEADALEIYTLSANQVR